jgi:hypothetical protein
MFKHGYYPCNVVFNLLQKGNVFFILDKACISKPCLKIFCSNLIFLENILKREWKIGLF